MRARHRRERRELPRLLAPREIRRRRQIVAVELHVMAARRLAKNEDDLRDIVAVLKDLDELARECVVDIGCRAVLIVRLLEIGYQAAD